ncbi:MAG: porin family protein [Gammaproteobacteria bacterium]|nr:porin family protein [Gammaproteobacteria bacterium]
MRGTIGFFAALLLLVSFSAQAYDDNRGSYWLIKGMAVDADVADFSTDPALNIGLAIGRDLGNPRAWAFELEYSQSVSDGEVEIETVCPPVVGTPCTPGTETSDFDFKTLSAYLVWRSRGDVYFKGKLGYSENKFDIDGTSDEDLFTDAGDDDYSVGIGFGLRSGWEVELVRYTDDVLTLSVGYRY